MVLRKLAVARGAATERMVVVVAAMVVREEEDGGAVLMVVDGGRGCGGRRGWRRLCGGWKERRKLGLGFWEMKVMTWQNLIG